jgi:hypothetical protein
MISHAIEIANVTESFWCQIYNCQAQVRRRWHILGVMYPEGLH